MSESEMPAAEQPATNQQPVEPVDKPFVPPPNHRDLKRWPKEHAGADGSGRKSTIW